MENIIIIFTLITIAYAIFISFKLYTSNKYIKKEKIELEELKEKLTEKDDYLQTIISSEPECVKLLAKDGTLLEINPAGAALVEAESPDVLLGRCIYDVVAPEYKNAYKKLVENVFLGKSQILEFQIISLKGNTLWMDSHAVPMRNHDGVITALLAITRDITARKNAEEKTKVKQEELMRVCRLLSVGEMASALAHELTQPLCARMGYAESSEANLEEKSPDIDKLRTLNSKIIQETERSGKIIHRIREFVCKREPNISKIDLNELILEVVELLRLNIPSINTKVELDLGKDAALVMADPIQVQQVLINLITNGIDAMKGISKTERKLYIKSSANCSGVVSVIIEDNGLGISKADMNRIFEPFYTTKEGGIGIGLAISRSIAESHGGRLYFAPNLIQGTRVTFELPAYVELQSEAAA